MKHTVYKTTNNVNNKYYIGVHSCNCQDCTYMGSGTALKAAIKKYGRENFTKQILHVCETRQKAFTLERELVSHTDSMSYNCISGGIGRLHPTFSTKPCVIKGLEFPSRLEAAKHFKVSPSTLTYWLYRSSARTYKTSIVFNEVTYSSISEASRVTGYSRTWIRKKGIPVSFL